MIVGWTRRPVHAWRGPWLAALALCTFGCGHSPRTTDPTFPPPKFGDRDSVFTDGQLFATAYSTYSVPPGFYSEPAAVDPVYYVNTRSILNDHQRPESPWTELSTEDSAQARAWADSTVANSNQVSPVADSPPIVTQRYFEFTDARVVGTTHVRMRVHRASYLTDVLPTVRIPDRAIATFQVRPVDAASVSPLIEYLWTTHGDPYVLGQKVLSSFATDTPADVIQTMYTLLLVPDDYDMRDRIQLRRLEYHVRKSSGVVTVTSAPIRDIHGYRR